jgi:hypothetical protein
MHLRLPHEGRTTPCRTARRLAQRQIRARLTEQLLETRPARLGNRKRGATLAGVKSPNELQVGDLSPTGATGISARFHPPVPKSRAVHARVFSRDPQDDLALRRGSDEGEPRSTSRGDHARSGQPDRGLAALRFRDGWSRSRHVPTVDLLNMVSKLEAPPGFEPGMEVLQTSQEHQSSCFVLCSGA